MGTRNASRDLVLTRARTTARTLTASTVEAPDPIASAIGAATSAMYAGELFVNRAVADAVPAYRRAKVLVGSSLGQLTLRQKGPDGVALPSIPFLRQPDPTRVTSAVITETVFDLADHGVGYWYNPDWNTPNGWRYADASGPVRKHKAIRHLPFDDLVETRSDAYLIRWNNRDVEVPAWAVIGFECAAGGWLRAGARAILTNRLLEDAARMYADTPQATTVLRNSGPRKTPEQVNELVNAFEAARRARSTAYVGRDIELESLGFDAQQIALTDARYAAILDIARLTGVPALYLAVGPLNASMTYVNATEARLDLYAAMMPFATAIAERLSFDDVTGNGVRVEFDFAPWLRVDPMYRANLYATLIGAGVMTAEQAAALEDFVPSTGVPR